MPPPNRNAPGGPGNPARWASSVNTSVGTALSNKSRVWFTLSHGILNEIYYPRIDQACIRDMGFIVTNGTDWCRRFEVEGFYVRITPTDTGIGVSCFQKNIHIRNVAAAEDSIRASHLVSPDALALVRFGLRAADDPRMSDTAIVIDALLEMKTPSGVLCRAGIPRSLLGGGPNATNESVISAHASRVVARVIHADEEWVIANTVRHVLGLVIEGQQPA